MLLTGVVGEKSIFAPLLTKFLESYRAKDTDRIESASIPGAGHYMLADNPEVVTDFIEQHAGAARDRFGKIDEVQSPGFSHPTTSAAG